MRSGSTETLSVGVPNTKELGGTELQKQAVIKQGVAFSEVSRNKAKPNSDQLSSITFSIPEEFTQIPCD